MLNLYSISSVILLLATILILIFITYFKRKFQYWEKKKVAYVTPSIPFGNTENPVNGKTPVGFLLRRIYQTLKAKGHCFGGVYLFCSPYFLLISPEIIKDVMTNNFDYFMDRGAYYNEGADPISAHLINLGGEKWKNLRAKITPTFSSGKIKNMLQTLIDCGKPLQDQLEKLCSSKEGFDIREFSCCYTTDVIGSCAFGVHCNSFAITESKFRKYCKIILTPKPFNALKFNFCKAFPSAARFLNISFMHKEVSKFFMDLVRDTVNYRLENNLIRKDFMQLLMDVKDDNGEGLTIEQMAAQSFVFFLGGFETTSTTMTFCLYELCKHQDIQNTLRKEIHDILKKHDGIISCESIGEMNYLNQVIDETLRKYPAFASIRRITTKDYKIPNTDIALEKGTMVYIPVYALQNDEEYFPNPEMFDPERFTEENKLKIVPYTYIPFGKGPRGCIGIRFGITQMQVGLITILKDYKLTLNARTETPLVFDPFSITLRTKNTIYLNVHKVHK